MHTPSRRTFSLVPVLLVIFMFVAFTSTALAAVQTITSSLNPSTFGQNVTFTWSGNSPCGPSTKAPAAPPPLINFYDGQTLIGSSPFTGTECGPISATFSTAALAVGTHRISAGFTSEGPSLNQVVNAAAPKDVPEGDTLLLLGGGMGGLATWLRYQWSRRKKS